MRTVEVNEEIDIDPLDDEWRALEWLIAHSPQDGVRLEDGRYVYVQNPSFPNGGKAIWITYTFTTEHVEILAAKVSS